MEARKDNSLRKRQLILDSSKKMFLWVAGASVVVGFAAVISWFLFQQIMFRQKVVAAKYDTVSILQRSNKAAPELTQNIRVLDTNELLQKAKARPEERTLQVILDALPADNNHYALGASMQKVLIGGSPNINLESFSINQTTVQTTASSPVAGAEPIYFSAVITSSDPNAIKEVLKKFERSIRTIDIDTLQLERNEERMTATIQGHAYYMPPQTVVLSEKVVKP